MEEKKVDLQKTQQVLNKEGNANKGLQGGPTPPKPNLPPMPPMPPKPTNLQQKQVVPVQKVEKKEVLENKDKKEPVKTTKSKKSKKEKKPKYVLGEKEQNEKPKNKRKLLYYILGSVSMAAVLVTILIIVILNAFADNEKLIIAQDNVVEVYAVADEFYFQAPENGAASYYIFEVKKGNENSILIVNSSNIYNASYLLDERATFQIRYYIQKQKETTRSLPSQWINFVSTEKLETPVIWFNEDANAIEFNYIENTDFYRIYYSDINDVSYIDFTPIQTEDDFGIASFANTLPNGVYDVTVVAMPEEDNLYYVASNSSNTLEISNYGQSEAVNGATYSLSGQTVTIDASNLDEIAIGFKIIVGSEWLTFTPQVKQDFYTIDLAPHNITITLGMEVFVVSVGDEASYILDSNQIMAVAMA